MEAGFQYGFKDMGGISLKINDFQTEFCFFGCRPDLLTAIFNCHIHKNSRERNGHKNVPFRQNGSLSDKRGAFHFKLNYYQKSTSVS